MKKRILTLALVFALLLNLLAIAPMTVFAASVNTLSVNAYTAPGNTLFPDQRLDAATGPSGGGALGTYFTVKGTDLIIETYDYISIPDYKFRLELENASFAYVSDTSGPDYTPGSGLDSEINVNGFNATFSSWLTPTPSTTGVDYKDSGSIRTYYSLRHEANESIDNPKDSAYTIEISQTNPSEAFVTIDQSNLVYGASNIFRIPLCLITNADGIYTRLKVIDYTGLHAISSTTHTINLKNAGVITFRDANFEAAVREVINKPTGSITYGDVLLLQDLSVSNRDIKDLTGIEYFSGLRSLFCDGNQLTELYLYNNKALTSLNCSNNQLTGLDISNNPSLEKLYCSYNYMPSEAAVTGLNKDVTTTFIFGPQVTRTVTFIDYDNTVLKTQNVVHGSAATAPADPSRPGFTFTGWDKAFDNVTSDLTVTATYAQKTYTVTFKDHDGTVLKTQTVAHGSAAAAPADPSRSGFTFTGWDKAFNNVTSDLTITAVYTESSSSEIIDTPDLDRNGGDVNGDLVVMADRVKVRNFHVAGDVYIRGRDIDMINISVGGDLYIYGTSVRISNCKSVQGNVYIFAANISFTNSKVVGDVTIDKAVADGDIYFNGLTARNIYVNGGGNNSIVFNDDIDTGTSNTVHAIIVNKPIGSGTETVSIKLLGKTAVDTITVMSAANIITDTDSDAGNVILTEDIPTGSTVTLSGAFTSLTLEAPNISIALPTNTVIGTLTITDTASGSEFTGTGEVLTALVDADVTVNFETEPNNTLLLYTITALAGVGGSISPAGTVLLTKGATQKFTITASLGYSIADVKVDGVSQGAVSAYTFTGVTSNHTISVTFNSQSDNSTGGNPTGGGSSYGGSSSGSTNQKSDGSTGVTINGEKFSANVTPEGVLTITLTKADIDGRSNTSGQFAIVILKSTQIALAVPISALGSDDFVIHTDFGSMTIPNQTLLSLRAAYGDTLRLNIKQGSFVITLIGSDGKEIPYQNTANPLTVILPYELKSGQRSGAVIALNKKGKVIPFAVYKDGFMEFEISETGPYDVMYNMKTFQDAVGHWAENYIGFTTARALYAGNEKGAFVPDGAMTRAMFCQVLANLEGVDLSAYKASRFSDVSVDAWYAMAIEWAAENGIVAGDGADKFAPDQDITREQMAVMLYNYIRFKNFSLPSLSMFNVFADEDEISSWAFGAVKAIQSTGIISGKPGNLYDPKTTASRAEVATIFARFIEVIAP